MDQNEKEVTTLDSLKQLKADYMKKVAEEGANLVKKEFKAVFDKYPELRAVTWSQYTPYFNDGEPCEFSVREFNGGTEDLEPEEIAELPRYFEDGEYGFVGDADSYKAHSAIGEYYQKYYKGSKETKYGYPFDQARYELLQRVDAGLNELSEKLGDHDDLMEMAFGDHVQVVATRDGFTVKDISHD